MAEPTKKDEPKKAAFDEKGHLPETNVPNKEQLHVHSGQIIDKKTAVLQTVQDAPIQSETTSKEILGAAKPTGSDVPGITITAPIESSGKIKAVLPTRPEENARAQSANEAAKYSIDDKSVNSHGARTKAGPVGSVQSLTNQSTKVGVDDGAIPGSRVGNPLQMMGENQMGDKVFDISEDGSHWLMVMNRDKSRAFSITGEDSNLADPGFTEIHKLRVEIKFPPISSKVSQRHLLILIDENQPCEMYFPPDVSHVQVLISKNVAVHCEMRHIDKDGNQSASYMIDFYSNTNVTPKPLEASPLGIELMGDVIVRTEVAQATPPKPVQGEFGRTAGGSPSKQPTGEAKKMEEAKVK